MDGTCVNISVDMPVNRVYVYSMLPRDYWWCY